MRANVWEHKFPLVAIGQGLDVSHAWLIDWAEEIAFIQQLSVEDSLSWGYGVVESLYRSGRLSRLGEA